jgi:hypothetical protein
MRDQSGGDMRPECSVSGNEQGVVGHLQGISWNIFAERAFYASPVEIEPYCHTILENRL